MAEQTLIRRIRNVATSEGLDKLINELKQGTNAQQQFAAASNVVSLETVRAAKSQIDATKAFEAQRKSLDGNFRALEAYKKTVSAVALAVSQGKATAEEYNQVLALAQQRYEQQIALEAARQAQIQKTINAYKAAQEQAARAAAAAQEQAAAEQRAAQEAAAAVVAQNSKIRAEYDKNYAALLEYRTAIENVEDAYTSGIISIENYTDAVARAEAQLRRTQVALVQTAAAAAKANSEAFAKTTFNIGVSASSNGAPASADSSAFALGGTADKTRSEYDAVFKAQTSYRQELQKLQNDLKAGAISEALYADALAKTKAAFVETMASLDRMSSARRASIADTQAQQQAEKAAADAALAAAEAQRALAQDLDRTIRSLERTSSLRAKFVEGAAAADEYAKYVAEAIAAVAAGDITEDEYAAAIDRRIASMDKSKLTAQAEADAAAEQLAAYKATRLELFPLEKAAATYQERLQKLESIRHMLTEDKYQEALTREANSYARVTKAIEESGNGTQKNLRLTGYEVTNLSYQLNDMVTMASSGSSAFQIFATQGGQVYQILAGARGGLVEGIKGLGGQLLALVTPATIAGAAFVAMGIAAYSAYSTVAESWKNLDTSVHGAGKSVGATAGELMSLAEAGASAAKVTNSTAASIVASFASTGQVNKDLFTDLVDVTNRYAKQMKVETSDAANELAEALKNPAKGAEDLDKKLNFLSASQLELIKQTDASGRKTEAQRLIINGLSRDLPDANRNIGLMASAWEKVSIWADKAATATGKAMFGANAGGLDSQIASAEARVKLLERVAANPPSYTSQSQADANLANAKKYLEALKTQQQTQAEVTRTAQTNTANKEATAVAEALNPKVEELRSLQKQLATVRAALYNPANAESGDLFLQTAEGLRSQISAITDGDGKLASISDKLRQRAELEIKVIQAKTATQKNAAEAALAAYDEEQRGSTGAMVAAVEETTAKKAQAEVEAQLSATARERALTKAAALKQGEIDIAQIGKTSIQQKLANDNLQDWIALERERISNGTSFDQRQYEALVKQNEALAAQNELKARLNILDEQKFQRDQLGRTPVEQTIASTQRSAGLAVDMNSTEAQTIRLTEAMRMLKDQSSTALDSFISDLIDGKSGVDALMSGLKSLAKSALSSASNNLISALMPQGGGLLSGLLGKGGGTALAGANVTGTAFGMFHGGGLVGDQPALTKRVDPSVFHSAPRYHTGTSAVSGVQGLTAGETPIIAMAGEEVGWPSQLAQKYGGGGGNIQFGDTHITIQGSADSKTVAEMEKRLATYQRQLPALAVNAVITAKNKGKKGL